MTESCPGCGGHRTVADRDQHSVVWDCQTCGISRETHDTEGDK